MLKIGHVTWLAHICVRHGQVDRELQKMGNANGQLTLSWMKGLTLSKGKLTVLYLSRLISNSTTCFFLDSPSDKAVATEDPG